jgi:CMP-N,N'-diacetyllegionaminic acid synthase
MKFLAIIPAREGSEGLKNKNFKKLGVKPLIEYTINAAKKSKYLDKFLVSTNDKKIINYCKKNKVNFIIRPKRLCLSNSKTIDAINHTLDILKKKGYIPDFIVTLQPTSPFRNYKHIDNAIKLFKNNLSADSLVSCQKIPHKFNPDSSYIIKKNFFLKKFISNNENIFIRQKKNKFYARNGAAIYITKIKHIKKFIFGKRILGYEMDEISSIDIDNLYDFRFAEFILKFSKTYEQ